MKYYSHKIHNAHLADLKKVKKELGGDADIKDIGRIYEHVGVIARTFKRDYGRIGIFSYNDLLQEGYAEMLYAWSKVDWDKIEESPNPEGQLWSYLKTAVKRGMTLAIMENRSSIRIPKYQYMLREEADGLDIFLSSTFSQAFGDDYFDMIEDHGDYNMDKLNEFLNDMMIDILEFKEMDILKKMFGMDEHLDKKVSLKELSNQYKQTDRNIKYIKKRALSKMVLNKERIEKFLDN